MKPETFDLLARIEDASLNASAPPQQRVIDGWLLRFSPGKAKRARSIQPIATGRLPLDEKLARCQQVYDEAGLPLLARITPFCGPPTLDADLADRGWRRIDDTRVWLRDGLADHVPSPLPNGLSLAPQGHELFAQTVGQLRGSTLAQRQAHGQRLAQSPVPFHARVLKRDGEVLACGQFALEGPFAGIYDVFTAPQARGQGLARLLCSHLLAEAASQGARIAYLQVEADNLPALAVYRGLGFIEGYRYHYRTPHPTAA